MADALDSKSSCRKAVWVQFPPPVSSGSQRTYGEVPSVQWHLNFYPRAILASNRLVYDIDREDS